MRIKPVVLLGEARGADEDRANSSFIGPSGAELLRMLNESGLLKFTPADREAIHSWYRTKDSNHLEAIWSRHHEVYRTNVFQFHPPGNDLSWVCGPREEAIAGYPVMLSKKPVYKHWRGGYVRAEFEPELERLQHELLTLDPNLIVCLGNASLWALAGRGAITKVRGTTLASSHTVVGFKLLPTLHPAYVIRDWPSRPTVIADLMKAKAESAFPEIRRPHREIIIEPGLADIERFIAEQIIGCALLSTDIETSGSRITCIGFAPNERTAIVIPFDDSRRPDGNYWQTGADERACWRLVRQVLHDPAIPKLFQNGLFDIAFLWRSMRIKVLGAREDTMLLSHALQPESLKGLGFLGSIFSDEGSWKHMRPKHETIKRDS